MANVARSNVFTNVEERRIRAGDIRRHPTHQRTSPLKRFSNKIGAFNVDKVVNPIHVVTDGNGGWFAVDGATRVEACCGDKRYGPDTQLPCKVYGNGHEPTGPELDELFLTLNSDLITVSAGIAFTRAVGARRPAAVAAAAQIKRLGPEFRSTTGVWKLVEHHGEKLVMQAVNEIIGLWDTKQHIPMPIVSAVVMIVANPRWADIFKRRRTALRKDSPDSWLYKAKNDKNKTVGTRDALSAYVLRRLLGRQGRKDI